MSLSHLLYVSRSLGMASPEVLIAIQDKAIRNNTSAGITGVLFYSAGNFIQLLEGDSQIVYDLYDRIRRDPRHNEVTLLLYRQAQERIFPSWSMGVFNLDEIKSLDLKELHDALEDVIQSPGGEERYERVLDLFETFRNKLENHQPAGR